LLLVVTLVGVVAAIGAGPRVPSPAGPGQVRAAERRLPPAPTFALPDLNGRTRALQEFLGSTPILLEFMSLDCPHCRKMAPILTRLHAEFGKRLQFLTVVFDRNPRRVRAFAEKEMHGWPFLIGNQETIDAYRLEGVPTFLLVTPDGRIGAFHVGSASYEAMRHGVEAFLGR
jgi:thiol-disulfide isomerase/thioredoxin